MSTAPLSPSRLGSERQHQPSNGAPTVMEQVGNGAAPPTASTDSLARNLGWFSLGLGLAQLLAPRQVARLVGVDDDSETEAVMRLVGLREIGSGVGLLMQAKPTPWLWARVGGDAMDLMLLSRALQSPESHRGRVLLATAAVLGIAAADTMTSMRMAGEPEEPYLARQQRPIRVTAAVTINAPVSEIYSWWEGFRQLPQFMQDAASIEMTDAGTTRWTFALPGGQNVAMDIELMESRPNEEISWRTGQGSPLSGSGQVRFRTAPVGRGTEVIFNAEFNPPGGELGKTVGGILTRTLGAKLSNDLRRLKQLIELGEIVRSDDSIIPGPNPAQPVSEVPADVARTIAAA